jgi:hypothetical protein
MLHEKYKIILLLIMKPIMEGIILNNETKDSSY